MSITTQQRTALRRHALQFAAPFAADGLTAEDLHRLAWQFTGALTIADYAAELDRMAADGLLAARPSALNPATPRYSITPKGHTALTE